MITAKEHLDLVNEMATANEGFTDLEGLVQELNKAKGSVKFSVDRYQDDALTIKVGEFTFTLGGDFKWGVMGSISGYVKNNNR